MGLDVTGFEAAVLLDPHEQVDECWDEHERAFIIDPSFGRSMRGLKADCCYLTSGDKARVSNSYSGHGRFRAGLARVFLDVEPGVIWGDPNAWAERPFFELIHFADNEGTIGPEAAADLLADFEAGRDQWLSAMSGDDWELRKYAEWTEVFRVAAGSGLVRFA